MFTITSFSPHPPKLNECQNQQESTSPIITLYFSSTTAFRSVSLATDSWLHVQYGSYQNQKWALTDERSKWSGTKELALRQNSDADCSKEEGQDELTWLFQSSQSKKLPELHILSCVHFLPLDLLNWLSNNCYYILQDFSASP